MKEFSKLDVTATSYGKLETILTCHLNEVGSIRDEYEKSNRKDRALHEVPKYYDELQPFARCIQTLAKHGKFSYPVKIKYGDRPDWYLEYGDARIGVELTRAVFEQREQHRNDKKTRGEPFELNPGGEVKDKSKRVINLVASIIQKKINLDKINPQIDTWPILNNNEMLPALKIIKCIFDQRAISRKNINKNDLHKECSTIMHMFRKKKSHELNKYIPDHLIKGHIDLVNKFIEKQEQKPTGAPYRNGVATEECADLILNAVNKKVRHFDKIKNLGNNQSINKYWIIIHSYENNSLLEGHDYNDISCKIFHKLSETKFWNNYYHALYISFSGAIVEITDSGYEVVPS